MSLRISVLFTILLCVSSLATAGTFEITRVSYDGWLQATYRLVIVVSEARYVGSLDPGDEGWLIQTFLNDSLGNDLDDWANPDF